MAQVEPIKMTKAEAEAVAERLNGEVVKADDTQIGDYLIKLNDGRTLHERSVKRIVANLRAQPSKDTKAAPKDEKPAPTKAKEAVKADTPAKATKTKKAAPKKANKKK